MLKRLLLWIVPPLGSAIIRGLYLSCRREFHLPKGEIDPSRPYIFVFWHGALLMQFFPYRRLRGDHKVAVIISEHLDGELIVRISKRFGVEAIRGSSRRGGVKALIGALRMVERGYDVAITPDGPRGPRYSVAPGVIALARKSGAPIIPLGYVPSSYWQLKSWDGFIIPKPFSKIDFYIGEPFRIDGLSDGEAELVVRDHLMKVSKRD
ncbi:MAG: lysophospholipid acyltransferase family protein [Epsilonproteobacteria bacterium]|nr:hypothetical protein [Campylobacterota bacterium]NPA56826.1 lysophospholipid acyltransferase family protein [Campylobacterota bacterium]